MAGAQKAQWRRSTTEIMANGAMARSSLDALRLQQRLRARVLAQVQVLDLRERTWAGFHSLGSWDDTVQESGERLGIPGGQEVTCHWDTLTLHSQTAAE